LIDDVRPTVKPGVSGMAIVDKFEATIVVHGEICNEYHYHDNQDQSENETIKNNNSFTKYIEVQEGQKFAVDLTTHPGFHLPEKADTV
jgi:hypothetical protein